MRYEGQGSKRRAPGPEELTLRAEEVSAKKACINVGHIAQDRWRPPLVDADWHAFCQAKNEGIEGRDWREGIVRTLQSNEQGSGSKEAKSCLLLRIVSQDALSEVTSIYQVLKLRVFVDDITVFLIGRNEELVESAEKVVKK